MNYSKSQLLAAIALVASVGSHAQAHTTNLPAVTQAEVETMIGAGMITFDPQTLQPVLNIDVVKQLQAEGRLKTKMASTGTQCTGIGSPEK